MIDRKLIIMAFTAGLFIMFCLPLQSLQSEELSVAAPGIVSALCDSLQVSAPVFLDIKCGEWSSVLENEFRQKLLSKKADIRELDILTEKETGSLLPTEQAGLNQILAKLGLEQAEVLEVSLEQAFVSSEKKGIFSYVRYRTPIYIFRLKQVALPEQKLISISQNRFEGESELENTGSLLALKWYEPLVAGATLASLVYMLWTIK